LTNNFYLQVFVGDEANDQVLDLAHKVRVVAHRHEVGEHENLKKIVKIGSFIIKTELGSENSSYGCEVKVGFF
jgi:hypothetical protein